MESTIQSVVYSKVEQRIIINSKDGYNFDEYFFSISVYQAKLNGQEGVSTLEVENSSSLTVAKPNSFINLIDKYPKQSTLSTLVLSLPTPETESQLSRIVNGYSVDISQVPYQATIRRRVTASWAHICGAVVIGPRNILTAGHCTVSYAISPSLLRVVVGTSSRLSGGSSYDVSRVIVHEEYSETTLQHDISLLITAATISFSRSVKAIPFAPSNFDLPDGTMAIVSGFGTTSYEGTSSSSLLAAQVNIIPHQTCARAYLRIATISSGMICAAASDPPRDACQGDSGGPLVANGHLVGLVSWGEGCADDVYPGVYTRVSQYATWIEDHLN